MPGLLYKNFRINFSAFLFVLIFTSVCCVIILLTAIIGGKEFVIENNGLFAMIGLYYVIFMMPSLTNTFLFEPDEGKTAGAFSMSLPQGAKGLVESKYLTILIEFLILLFLCFLTDTISHAFTGGAFLASVVLIYIFCLRLLLSAVEVPFLIRFGTEHGLSIKSLLVIVLTLLAALYFLFGDITWLIGTDEPFKELIKWLQGGRFLLFFALFPFLSIGAYVLSCRISILLYRKGVENHEE